jgi:hypothetical protein
MLMTPAFAMGFYVETEEKLRRLHVHLGTAMRCPVCKLENPENARRCDCGHEFSALGAARSAPDYLGSIDSSVRTIKFVVVAWAVLTVIGFTVWLLAVAMQTGKS